jgi:hypothetical protein
VLFSGPSTWTLGLILLAVMQAALIGFVGLVLAVGISLAVGRYEARPRSGPR